MIIEKHILIKMLMQGWRWGVQNLGKSADVMLEHYLMSVHRIQTPSITFSSVLSWSPIVLTRRKKVEVLTFTPPYHGI